MSKRLFHGKLEFGFMAESDQEAQGIVRKIANEVMKRAELDSITAYRQVEQWREVP